jgi:hypothetical protein
MIRPVDINLNIQHAPDMARLALTEQQNRPELKKKTEEKKKPPWIRTTGENMYDIRI